MDDKIKTTLDKVVLLTQQNEEFGENLRKALEIEPSASVAFMQNNQIDEIYEYCIEQILKKQAQDFYKDFPISRIKNGLIDDFVRMESFRRKNNFGDFCLALYQQIESIANSLCENAKLNDVALKMWGYPAYVKNDKNSTIKDRVDSDYSIAKLVFSGNDKDGNPNFVSKSHQSIQTFTAREKVRTIIYFVCYQATMKSADFNSYIEITNSISDIYQCRNMNHRGNTLTDWEKQTLDRILPLQSYYSFKFMGVLAQFVHDVVRGFNNIDQLYKYTENIIPIQVKLEHPKILKTIELSEADKKRFNR